jgi:predicted MPP superfamily phosphohydrolase
MDKPKSNFAISRRMFLKMAGGVLALVGTGGLTDAYAWNVEPQLLVVEEVHVSLPRLPQAFDGLVIGFLSDFHVNGPSSPALTARAAEMLMAYKPDLVALGGDFITRSADDAASCVDALAQLRAPLGVFGILGNHDYWAGDTERTVATLTRGGIRILRNESIPIGTDRSPLFLIGLDDLWEKHADLPRALSGVPRDVCKILLVHEPDFADEAAKAEIALQLSGHSHGGQVRLPFFGAPILPYLATKYPIGLQRAGPFTQVYTTRGIGLINPAIRFNCPPEVTVLRMRAGA